MFHLITLLVSFYVAARFIAPTCYSFIARGVASIVLIVSCQHHLIWRIAFGSMFSPEVPKLLILLVNVIYPSVLILAVLHLVIDVSLILIRLLNGRWLNLGNRFRLSMACVVVMFVGFGVYQAVKLPRFKHVEVSIMNLPRNYEGYRIIQLTDLHISRLFQRSWTEAIVKKVNEQTADLVLITGDVIDGTVDIRRRDVEPLRNLEAKDGVFAIPGNHEYYFGYDEWMEEFSELGMDLLVNSHVVLTNESDRLVIAGVTDASAYRHGMIEPDERLALKDAPKDVPSILLSHQPKRAFLASEAGVDLQLSGHTHGGMIKGFDLLVAKFNNGFASGLYQVGNMQLYVSNGTALWPGFAVRLGVPSEITVITLKSNPSKLRSD